MHTISRGSCADLALTIDCVTGRQPPASATGSSVIDVAGLLFAAEKATV
jgi:hypothetical protein